MTAIDNRADLVTGWVRSRVRKLPTLRVGKQPLIGKETGPGATHTAKHGHREDPGRQTPAKQALPDPDGPGRTAPTDMPNT